MSISHKKYINAHIFYIVNLRTFKSTHPYTNWFIQVDSHLHKHTCMRTCFLGSIFKLKWTLWFVSMWIYYFRYIYVHMHITCILADIYLNWPVQRSKFEYIFLSFNMMVFFSLSICFSFSIYFYFFILGKSLNWTRVNINSKSCSVKPKTLTETFQRRAFAFLKKRKKLKKG